MSNQYSTFDLNRINKPMPDGIHNFQIVDATENDDTPSGYPSVLFTLECHEDAPWNEQKVFLNVSLAPKARWKLEEFLDATGAPESGRGDASMFVGKMVKARTKLEDYVRKDGTPGQRVNVLQVLPVNHVESETKEEKPAKKDMKNLKATPKPSANIPDDVLEDEQE